MIFHLASMSDYVIFGQDSCMNLHVQSCFSLIMDRKVRKDLEKENSKK